MKTSATILLLSASSIAACPGSPARMHAKCEMALTFSQPCNDVLTEINARVSGKNGWTDPHNGGQYSITNQTSTFLSGQRVTGDAKYTDLFEFSLTTTSGGCSVEACSESQVNSLLDYSTNYCNLHSLYCSAASGCPTVGADLTYSEDYTSCTQHDDVCVASLKAHNAISQRVVKVKDEQQCTADVGAASTALATAGIKIADATVSCADGFSSGCNNDVDAILVALTEASYYITAAVYDCAGTEPTLCSEDINNIISDLTAATIKITDAVISCASDLPGSTAKCTADIAAASKAVGSLARDIGSAVENC